MGLGGNGAGWRVRDSFGEWWRLSLAEPGAEVPLGEGAPADERYRMEALVYFAFHGRGPDEHESALTLVAISDELTGDCIADRLRAMAPDERPLASFLPEVERALSNAFRGGNLLAEFIPRPALDFDDPPEIEPVSAELDVPKPEETTWVEICLVDADGNPRAGARYRVTPPSGVPSEGKLDDAGKARLDGIDPGACEVVFPEDVARPA